MSGPLVLKDLKKAAVEVYQFHFEPYGWAFFYIHEYPKGGILAIVSDWGNYAYAWGSIGTRTFKEFLVGCGPDYIMNKLGYGHSREFCEMFDSDATIKGFRDDLLKRRRSKEFTADEARELWDIFEEWHPEKMEEWYYTMPEEISERWCDIHEWFVVRPSPTYRYMEDELIPFFQRHLRDELKPKLKLAEGA